MYPATLPEQDVHMSSAEPTNMEIAEEDSDIAVGTLGFWKGPLNESKVGVLLEPGTLQTYKKARFGMIPEEVPKDAKQWTSENVLDDYGYEQKGNRLYLVF